MRKVQTVEIDLSRIAEQVDILQRGLDATGNKLQASQAAAILSELRTVRLNLTGSLDDYAFGGDSQVHRNAE